jgi:small nuclear ribonucleoprotein (snRNP)-like protein
LCNERLHCKLNKNPKNLSGTLQTVDKALNMHLIRDMAHCKASKPLELAKQDSDSAKEAADEAASQNALY